MKRALSAAAIALLVLPPGAFAQEGADGEESIEEGFSLFQEGAKIIMRGMLREMEPALDDMQQGFAEAAREWGPAMRELMRMVGDFAAYHPPEMQPNGDIIIRKKTPEEMERPGVPEGGGEIEL